MEAEARRATATSLRRRSPVRESNRPKVFPFGTDYRPHAVNKEDIYRVPEKKHILNIPLSGSSSAPNVVSQVPPEGGWPASRLAGRVVDGTANALRSYWQQNVARDERHRQEEAQRVRPKPYGFPRWRSSDALSASLVASNPVEIPRDSRIPDTRLAKMRDTEREAVQVKHTIQAIAEPQKRLSKGKSLDSLILVPEQPNTWYNRDKIREGISRESIANISAARQRFEAPPPPPPPERSLSSSVVPPPLPPKSEEVLLRQQMHRNDSYDEYNAPSIASYSTIQDSTYTFQSRDHPSSLNYEQQLLLLYLRQNPHVAEGLGIAMPESTRQAMEELAWRRVELRVAEEEQNSYTPQSFSPSGRPGRYVKRPQQLATSAATPARFRKGAVGDSLIAAEIRAAREREEELRRSRSELGLPTLEDTMDMWRSGQRVPLSVNGMRSAVSYDQLHHENGVADLQKTSSIGELNRENFYERDDGRREQRTNYRLQNTEDQDIMYYGPPSRRLGQPPRFANM